MRSHRSKSSRLEHTKDSNLDITRRHPSYQKSETSQSPPSRRLLLGSHKVWNLHCPVWVRACDGNGIRPLPYTPPPTVSEPSTTSLKAKVWSIKTSSKIKHFIWNVLSNSVLVCSRLTYRYCGTDRHCPRCGADNETVNHLLFECPPSVQVWALAHIPHSPGLFPSDSIFSNLNHLLWRAKGLGIPSSILDNVPWILWFIWKARNDKLFNGNDTPPLDIVQIAISEACNWRLAQILQNFPKEEEALPSTIAQPLGP